MNVLYHFLAVLFLGVTQVGHAKVIVGVTIHSYSNPNGTAYVETSSARKCCDDPQRQSCETGDTCDTYFDICIGSMKTHWGCKGAFMTSRIYNNTNNITNVPELRATSDFWGPGMTIFVFIRDDDSHGTIHAHDHIDTLIDTLDFNPDNQELLAQEHDYDWLGKTQLSLTVKVWCASNLYGDRCDKHCTGIQQIVTCNRQTGQLSCQYSDDILLEFKNNTTEDQLPQLAREINSFVANEVCPSTGQPEVDLPQLDVQSNTLSFTAYCDNREITPLEFESLVQLKTDQALKAYFPAGVVRGPVITPRNYGEHVIPNVYLGIEIKSFDHPLGTSFNGNNVNGSRQCCDVPKTNNCDVEEDRCDVHLSICIGKLVNEACIGAYVSSPTYANTTSLDICGPTLLDHSNGLTFVTHPMIGAMRLTENVTSIDVAVQDSDLNGHSFDIIDQISLNFTLSIGANVSVAEATEVILKNVVTLKLNILAWCAPGHDGPTCLPVNGTDICAKGWYGADCDKQVNLCHPNPCGSGQCVVVSGKTNCTCPPGLQGPRCSQDVNECNNIVCQNNATCENKFGSFICHCTPGWDGLICSESTVCYPPPCVHGTCSLSNHNSYECKCDRGWMGQNCSEKYVCDNSTCLNGQCYMSDCLCYDGFEGPQCSQDKDECKDNPCQNAGTCINTIGSFTCACAIGFTGKVCENTTGPCPVEFCSNGGTCSVDSTGNQSCLCPSNYTGPHCAQINLCGMVTCEHNFTCEQFADDFDFVCICDSHWSGKTCDVDVNECKRKVCQHNGSCTNLPGSYMCSCQNGWTGVNCENDINECTNMTLCNHGYCINSPGSFKCVCEDGYTGQYCQTKIQHCHNVTCSNHGSCHDDILDYLCACQVGWIGNDCGEDINECKLNYCGANKLSCNNSPGGYNCTCQKGWGGVNCSKDINECTGHPCHGNGVCTNINGGYSCNCYSGFTGSQCEVFINRCAYNKCMNGGTCHVTQNGTECICTDAWTGRMCEHDVNECLSRPCKNFGSCLNTNGSFDCSCSPGWTGHTCESDINECITAQCKNNGLCSNLPGSYKCACQTGWQGQLCEVKRLMSLSGVSFDMHFVRNVSAIVQQQTISSLYKFIQNICGNVEVKLFIKSIIGNVIQFVSTCGNSSLSENQIQTAFKNTPETVMEQLFPVPFTGVWQSQKKQTTQSPESKSWIHDHWPVLAGCLGAAVIITVVVVIGCFRDRRHKKKQDQGFNNPIFSSDHTNYS